MNTGIRLRLSAMMFLQYFVWGAWWVPFGSYLMHLGLSGWIGAMFSAQGWAAILSSLFVGTIADRYFAAEKVVGVLHLLGSCALLALSFAQADPALVFTLTLAALAAYMPTLALSNTIAFHALSDTERQFPAIRVVGTIGWIIAGLIVGWLGAEQTTLPLRLAAAASALHGLYAFTLPTVPPSAGSGRAGITGILGLDAVRHGDRSFWSLIVCSLLLMIPLSFYYAYANPFLVTLGVNAAAGLQTIGQVSEVGLLLLLPLFLRWLGIKAVLLLGMLAWTARYGLFALGFDSVGPHMPMLLPALALHGVCFDFFLVAGQIWVDKRFPSETRGRAQSFLTLVTWGVGSIIGSLLANATYVAHSRPGQAGAGVTVVDWTGFWLIPSAMAAMVGVAFALSFRNTAAMPARPER
ncbi:MFS transporter [Novosphingobium fluoreni]|uniref:MFS transporter n=1 Tax=Novosphingobium fluoreni TaxID=1391222 RepID=UPI003DA093C7